MHPTSIFFSVATIFSTLVAAAPPRGVPAEMAKPLLNIPEVYARLPVDHLAGSRNRPTKVKSSSFWGSRSSATSQSHFGIQKDAYGRCADTTELVKCQDQCLNIFGPHSRFFNDCNECCRKSCDPTGDCGLDSDY
ncbi:hypothetical protein BJ508DRAFT_307855 [Ascobolus immersus RN42]|uniref:Uncharacterized protein n=1 Tax=Ascobolus immersus RN42 TaxID=1160509 RepID=A0A3N4I761_ASCIM|nr:hypothetical protein BJ508DRAFT_307855 [Ascobolus immersus RN42]